MIAGNALSALVGISCFRLFSEMMIALPLAVAFSIFGLLILLCLNPSAAAVALMAVLGHIGHYRYTSFFVMVDTALLILMVVVYSNLTGKPYPISL